MKRFFYVLSLSILSLNLKAQNSTLLPPFRLLKTDSSYFTTENLKKGSNVMVIYFGTDCSHCKLYTKELLKHMDVLSKVQILMITWTAVPLIRNFSNEYGLDKYPNFIVTTEGYSAVLYRFFHVKTTPYTAIYNKNHQLIKVFDKSPVIDSLLAAVKK